MFFKVTLNVNKIIIARTLNWSWKLTGGNKGTTGLVGCISQGILGWSDESKILITRNSLMLCGVV